MPLSLTLARLAVRRTTSNAPLFQYSVNLTARYAEFSSNGGWTVTRSREAVDNCPVDAPYAFVRVDRKIGRVLVRAPFVDLDVPWR